ncbi:MAG: YkgJ family cysteine cluster protein [Verrucomicrobiia bacterium]
MPVYYECQRCTACCRWPGEVRLSGAEIAELAAFKRMSEFDFIQAHTRLTSDRRGLALVEEPDGACIFLEGMDCAVQPVKPRQCRAFPNAWNFPGFERICRAIPRPVSAAVAPKVWSQASQSEEPPAFQTSEWVWHLRSIV